MVRLIALEALWATGAAPGNPATERPRERMSTSHKTLARNIGISDKTLV